MKLLNRGPKIFRLILLTLTLFLLSCSKRGDVSTPQKLGEQIIEALEENDYDKFHSLYADLDDYEDVVDESGASWGKRKRLMNHVEQLEKQNPTAKRSRIMWDQLYSPEFQRAIKKSNEGFGSVEVKALNRGLGNIAVGVKGDHIYELILIQGVLKTSDSYLITGTVFHNPNGADLMYTLFESGLVR